MKRILSVYVAGPMTSSGDRVANIRAAIDASNQLLDIGIFPYCPHLSELWQLVHPRTYEEWMSLDLFFLKKCDVVLRLPGSSVGADREEQHANRHGIRVCRSVLEIKTHNHKCDTYT